MSPIELSLFIVLLVLGLLPLWSVIRHSRALTLSVLAVCLVSVALGSLYWSPAGGLPPVDERPLHVREGTVDSERGFVSSNACRSCHPGQYATWHRTFHRTMTQVVTPETMIADPGEIIHPYTGERYLLERRGDGYWVQLPSESHESGGVESLEGEQQSGEQAGAWRRLVMSTGLHHYQLYWYPSGWGREVHMFPFVFLSDERRWVPRSSVFLTPPDLPESRRVWNANCISCHTTDGRPNYSDAYVRAARRGEASAGGVEGPDTRVAEMGIACEACHGPGREHVEANLSPLRRYGNYWSEGDSTMVHPERQDPRTASQICAQCHSINYPHTFDDLQKWLSDGPEYTAGSDLNRFVYIVRPETVRQSAVLRRLIDLDSYNLDSQFWSDGQVRVTGREYNGLIASPCYQGGEFSCLSCHSMHESDPEDQLSAGMDGDEACLQCHESFRSRIQEHTHHNEDSGGSRCYNCHMPHTTYGLLKASRSHTVDSPSVLASIETGRPNACNGCHLDKTLAWTNRYLKEWYDIPVVELDTEHEMTAASLLWLLRGDAGQRALAAWAMGWESAHEASEKDWLAPFLAIGLTDPYDVVRYISERSLKRLPGFENFSYDFVGSPEQRLRATDRAIDQWAEMIVPPVSPGSEVLMDKDGTLHGEKIKDLLENRDLRPMTLAE